MKKVFLFMCALVWTAVSLAQSYGILVNGNTYFAGEAAGEYEGFTQYLAHVTVHNGDQCQLYDKDNNAAWAVDLNTYSVAGFTRNGDHYNISTDGCYDFYIKLKYEQDELYIGNGEGCGDGEVIEVKPACTDPFGLLVDGKFVAGAKNDSPLDPSFLEYSVTGLVLKAGQKVQVYDPCNEAAWVITKYAETSYEFTIVDNHYTVSEDGTYDFYLKFKYEADEIYVACSGCKEQPKPSSAVPSQCGDVLMQGFYYDSYEVDENHLGTSEYGDTKWKTLLAQAGEIGAYFDLIWLPPSGYASGTGYHPKQYSNQNSDWGSRSDLEKLIAAFHNSGTKVVADIVINHVEAMSSWCDFAVQDFGEYGKFEPDGSYICSTDEMNNAANKKEAGECFGTATGSPDDGANWDAARDWSHDKVYVQEMFKAYLKWMRDVMKYDGWRYDKGDGFNNWHMDNYNKASQPYIAFMEYWSGNDEIIGGIEQANRNVMALDFQTKYSAFDGIAGFDYSKCKGSGLLGRGYSKYAITFVDSHDWFLRDNGQEFGGNGNSMKPELKDRLMQANAFLLSMPGVPCVFYPHWAKYKADLKPMINARHLAGVHSESPVTDEEAEQGGYKCTVQGKNGYLILCLGNKAGADYSAVGYSKVASGGGYAIWVNATGDVAPGIIATQSATFEDKEKGINVTIEAVGGSRKAVIYYTTDGSEPTTASKVYSAPLNFKETTTLKVMAVCGNAQSNVQEYTYTYREPLQHGIRVRFDKPAEWDKVYIYAWQPGEDEQGNPTSENIMGAYPGQRIYRDAEGWFSYEFDLSLKTVHFCINSGDDCGGVNVRSNDLETDYDACYGWREGKETDSSEEVLLDCDTDLNPAFDLVISPESGFFRDTNEGQTVEIHTVGAENAMIYYTTDGSEPTTASSVAQGAVSFTVNKTTTVKAFAALDKEQTATYSETYTYKAPQQGAITVRFVKPEEWETLYLYAFTRVKVGSKYKDTPYPLDGKTTKWPGMKWTETDGIWHTHTMPADIKEIYVIFTEGDKKPQTQDIFLDENACYLWSPDCWKAVLDVDCDGTLPEGLDETEAPVFDAGQPMYNILGQRVNADYMGIVIQNGHKFLLIK